MYDKALTAAVIVFASSMMTSCASMQPDPTGTWAPADIAAVMVAANDGEIAQGQVATSRASSDEVRAFAQMMLNDHTAANTSASALFADRGITPSETDTSRTLRQSSAETVAAISSYSGSAFDRVYMDAQVTAHEWLLRTLDTNMIPSAEDSRLRDLLTAQRASVAAHLERARSIAGRLR